MIACYCPPPPGRVDVPLERKGFVTMHRFPSLSTCLKASLKTSAAVLAAAIGAACLGGPSAHAADKDVDFAADIQPIFKASCVRCHGLDPNKPNKKASGGLRLDDKAGAMKGGKAGSDIVPGNAKGSLLYELLLGPHKDNADEIPAMPKPKKGEAFKALPQDQINLIQKWIDQGAKWPD
jgi:mono/diheme cytochrome c family protein